MKKTLNINLIIKIIIFLVIIFLIFYFNTNTIKESLDTTPELINFLELQINNKSSFLIDTQININSEDLFNTKLNNKNIAFYINSSWNNNKNNYFITDSLPLDAPASSYPSFITGSKNTNKNSLWIITKQTINGNNGYFITNATTKRNLAVNLYSTNMIDTQIVVNKENKNNDNELWGFKIYQNDKNRKVLSFIIYNIKSGLHVFQNVWNNVCYYKMPHKYNNGINNYDTNFNFKFIPEFN